MSVTHADLDVCLCSPLGVVVNEDIVFHRQFEVWDLLTHPPGESTHLKLSPDNTPDKHLESVTYTVNVGVYMRGLSQKEKRSLTEWSR